MLATGATPLAPPACTTAGFGALTLSGERRTAASISASVGRLTLNTKTSAAIAPSAAPKKNPSAQW